MLMNKPGIIVTAVEKFERQFEPGHIAGLMNTAARPTIFVGNVVSRLINGKPFEPNPEQRAEIGTITVGVGMVALALASHVFVFGQEI